jgi:hypothetical protein
MKTLDIRQFKQTGKQLMTEIEEAVADSQRVIIQQLYDELLMTQAQFNNLQATGGTFESYVPDFYLYRTKHNVMEVRVADPDPIVGEVKEEA